MMTLDNYGSGSGSSGMCDFTFFYDESVGRVGGVGSGVLFRLELIQLVTFFRWLCFYQEELSPMLVDS